MIQPSSEGKEQGPAKMLKLRAQAGKQPRGKKCPELVKEFKEIVHREVTVQDVELLGLKQKNKINLQGAEALAVPYKSKIIAIQAKTGVEERMDVSIGIYFTHEEFLEEVLRSLPTLSMEAHRCPMTF